MASQQFPEFKAVVSAPVSVPALMPRPTPERLVNMARNLSQLRASLAGRLRSGLARQDFINTTALLGAVEAALSVVEDEQRFFP